jgi:hypothetical protein
MHVMHSVRRRWQREHFYRRLEDPDSIPKESFFFLEREGLGRRFHVVPSNPLLVWYHDLGFMRMATASSNQE